MNREAHADDHLVVTVAPLNQWLWKEKVPRGAEQGNAKRTRKRSTLRVLFFARKLSETVSDELCKVSQKQQQKTFCMWLEKVKKDYSYFEWLNLHLISL